MKFIAALLLPVALAYPQSDAKQVSAILARDLQTADVTGLQLRQYAMQRVKPLRTPGSATEWNTKSRRIRQHLLQDVIFHGWPKEWVDSKPQFVDAGVIEGTDGYRATRLRYEVVPGFYSSAILYEPADLKGKVPAILNVNGHVGSLGKAVEYKQKRCIDFAKRGMIALSLEWIGHGELSERENAHSFGGHLDLVGANGVGLFYLAMRRGLDYLDQHPDADRTRLGVTGLSGGGWQTITLSSLDERVNVAVPVAGFSSLTAAIEHPEYVGNDIEQNATDFRDGQDYADLTAMRAPRPTLLIYNAEDDCCFRAGIVKSGVFEEIRPFFRLLGKEDNLRWHENSDPGTHNYQLDNRLQAYRFFSEKFGMPLIDRELSVGSDIRTFDELRAGLPKDNLTILGLARQLAKAVPASTPAEGDPAAQRTRLRQLLHYRPATVRHAWPLALTKNKGVETRSYLFEMDNGLCATGVWFKAISTADGAPLTLVLNDRGKKETAEEVSDRVNRGEQVLAVDPLFFGDNSLALRIVPQYTQLVASMGDRPLAMEAAQVAGIGAWLKRTAGAPRTRIDATGMRSQTVALIVAALEPAAAGEIEVHDAIPSLRYLLDKPVPYEAAPDLFCLDLYREFDLPRLTELARPARIHAISTPSRKP